MKTLLFFISFLVTVPSICLSQDLIISKTQDTIPCKIWSIGDTQIKIHLMDNVDTTAVKRSHYTEYFRKGNWHLLERRTPTPKANNPASKNLYPAIGNDFLAAGNSLIIGSLLGLSGAVLAGLGGVVNANGSKDAGTAMMIGGGVMATVGIVLDFRGFIKIRQSGKKLKNPERIKRRSMSPYTER